MGNIGEERRRIEVLPLTPAEPEPAPRAPEQPQPQREPEPAK
jgi:hypothetical protein